MKTGRTNKYDTHIKPNFDVIRGYLRSGYTEESIARRLGIGRATWKRHKRNNEEFREVVKTGQQDIGALCVNNLLKRANGYEYDEEHAEKRLVDGIETTVVKKIKKHIPPDVAANCVILFNRMPGKWKNKHEIKHSGQIKNAGVLLTGPPLDKESWLKFYKENVEKKPSKEQT